MRCSIQINTQTILCMKGSSDCRLLSWARPQVHFLSCSHIWDALLYPAKTCFFLVYFIVQYISMDVLLYQQAHLCGVDCCSRDYLKEIVCVLWLLVGLSSLLLWCKGLNVLWNCIRFFHWYETVIRWIIFTLVQNLWIPGMAFRCCQFTGWWRHYNYLVTILGQG